MHVCVQLPPSRRKLRAEEVMSETLIRMIPLWGRTKYLSNRKGALPRTAYLCSVPCCPQAFTFPSFSCDRSDSTKNLWIRKQRQREQVSCTESCVLWYKDESRSESSAQLL